MKKQYIKSSLKKIKSRIPERGQAIVLFAFALVGLIAMVGLVTDTGILLIEYGKLKRGVDAAAISAAQQYRLENADDATLNAEALENAARNFLQLNESGVDSDSILVTSCESPEELRPERCNDDPLTDTVNNRKYVQVTGSKTVKFGFLNLIGFNSTTITVTSVGEAATVDLVLAIDTSASMAYETTGDDDVSDPGDDPSACNDTNSCQPMQAVKEAALEFVNTLYFPYDRVAIITMTSQVPDGSRDPEILLPLSSDRDGVNGIIATLTNIKVFEPRECDGSGIVDGLCRQYSGGVFNGMFCEIYELTANNDPSYAWPDYRSCPSSNVGGLLKRAGIALTDAALTRTDSFWVVVTLVSGPANATDVEDAVNYPYGYCPFSTYLVKDDDYPATSSSPYTIQTPFCRDRKPSVRHDASDTIDWEYPSGTINTDFSIYDADDYARDWADNLANLVSGEGVTIFTIGLGDQVTSTNSVDAGEDPAAESLLKYIAECAGENDDDDCETPVADPQINHGQYFAAATSTQLSSIFNKIANNIATRISQ